MLVQPIDIPLVSLEAVARKLNEAIRALNAVVLGTTPNMPRDEICDKTIESHHICAYCVHDVDGFDCISQCKRYDEFVGRKLSPVG